MCLLLRDLFELLTIWIEQNLSHFCIYEESGFMLLWKSLLKVMVLGGRRYCGLWGTDKRKRVALIQNIENRIKTLKFRGGDSQFNSWLCKSLPCDLDMSVDHTQFPQLSNGTTIASRRTYQRRKYSTVLPIMSSTQVFNRGIKAVVISFISHENKGLLRGGKGATLEVWEHDLNPTLAKF